MTSHLRPILCLALFSAAGGMLLATSARATAGDTETARLAKELTDLVEARRESISTLEIVADLVSSPRQLLPNTPLQIHAILDRYVSSARSDSDRQLMYGEFFRPDPQRQKPLAKQVRIVQDGPRSSTLQGGVRSVTDDRASILVSPREPGVLQVQLWKPGKATSRLTSRSDFSWELDCPWLIPTRPYDIVSDDGGQLVLSWKDGRATHRMDVSVADGILNHRMFADDDKRSLILQVGRISAPEGIPFPAVVCHCFYQHGSLRMVDLYVPTSIRVNQPVDPEEFRIAVPAKTVIIDDGAEATRIELPGDIDDLVDFALMNGIHQD
ncbi:hypothetical protein Pan44_15520 [Caulifigura coniformis]|uniref:Secreted protein n=1 Tax=Caulifigura coniformis TaxID=2527983 RepID=A0A517SBL2_9PLAN|nr:hypothetical protein [Caulifigura coniformis]QDT53530.1 hypothetical protein Pan44_15520 [Caulifigura coniformis]